MYTVELYDKDTDLYYVISNYSEEEKEIAIEVCKALNIARSEGLLRLKNYLNEEFDWVQVTDDNTGKPIFVNNEEYKA